MVGQSRFELERMPYQDIMITISSPAYIWLPGLDSNQRIVEPKSTVLPTSPPGNNGAAYPN